MIRLAIIEDNLVYLDALEAYITKVTDLQLVHKANNLQDLPSLFSTMPDVVIMDINLGKDSGIHGVNLIKEALPGVGILMLTVFNDEEKIVRSIQAGASGYLLKRESPKKITEAVRDIYKGEGAISGQVAKTIFEVFPKPTQRILHLDSYGLSKREREILLLLIDGLSYKEIAAKSFISMATLNTHIRNIYNKLGMHSRAEIAARFHNII